MRATLQTVGSNFYIGQISQFSKIFQFCIFATIFQSFAIFSVFELDTSPFGFWAFFHVSLGVNFQNLPVPVSRSGGNDITFRIGMTSEEFLNVQWNHGNSNRVFLKSVSE